jgi:hypothetical protein
MPIPRRINPFTGSVNKRTIYNFSAKLTAAYKVVVLNSIYLARASSMSQEATIKSFCQNAGNKSRHSTGYSYYLANAYAVFQGGSSARTVGLMHHTIALSKYKCSDQLWHECIAIMLFVNIRLRLLP